MSHRGLRRWRLDPRSALLTTGAFLGVLGIVTMAAAVLLGVRPLVVTSGSMSPAIPAGSLVVVQDEPASEVQIGDVVAVDSGDGGRVMHRVVMTAQAGDRSGRTVLTLQGDANATPDRDPYLVDRVGSVRTHVPFLGYPVTWLGTPIGLLVLGALACGLVLFAFRPEPRSGGRRRAAAVLAVPVAAATVVSTTPAAQAYFDDPATVTSTALATHTVAPPASVSCSSALLAATVSWPADPRYDYEVVLRRASNSAVVSTTQVTGASSSITYSGLASFGLVVGAGTVDFQVEVRSYLVNATSWQSATTRNYAYVEVLAILIGATATCTT